MPDYPLFCITLYHPIPPRNHSINMNLIIDQGNTRCKTAVFDEHGKLLYEDVSSELTTARLERVIATHRPTAGIFSTVLPENESVTAWLKAILPRFVPFTVHTPMPLKVDYRTPETLGLDRLAAAVGAWTLVPNRTLLVIDMGTAVTYDLVSRDGVYLGGNIAPGVQLRFRSLHAHTGKMPLVEPTTLFDAFGKDTVSAVRAGVMQGIVHETHGYIEQYTAQYPDLFAFLTGGDLIYFAENLKSGIFVCENLVLTGLNAILNYHARI